MDYSEDDTDPTNRLIEQGSNQCGTLDVELRRQKRRLYYANNKERINKRRRELRAVNAERKKIVSHTQPSSANLDNVTLQQQPLIIYEHDDVDHQVADSEFLNVHLVDHELLNTGIRNTQTHDTSKIEGGQVQCSTIVCDVTPDINEQQTQTVYGNIDAENQPVVPNQHNNLDDDARMFSDDFERADIPTTRATDHTIRSQPRNRAGRQHQATGRSRRVLNSAYIDDRTLVLPKVPPCKYCGAFKFFRETDRICCSAGEVMLAESVLPDYLIELITGTDAQSREFQNQIRTYNNHFAYTSIGIHCDEQYQRRDHGIYTVKVQGQIYHFLNDLIPHHGSEKMSGLQFYFYDPEHQAENRMLNLPRLNAFIVLRLVRLMESNPYSQFLKRASSLKNPDQYHIVIRSDPGLDQRRYNKPSSSEVAGIWIEDDNGDTNNFQPCDIRVYTKSGRSQSVKYYYACYDPLQYVLMFPNGEPGWHGNIPRSKYQRRRNSNTADDLNPTFDISNCRNFEDMIQREEEGAATSIPYDAIDEGIGTSSRRGKRKRSTVSCREYYVYKLQDRDGDKSYILRFGRLLQQYVIDNYIKLESMRLEYLRNNQRRLRCEHYQGVIDSVESGVQLGGRVGMRIYLPASFIGGPRDMKHRYLDSMALVQEYGRPDIFLTITCNPNWPEITERLKPGEEAHNRPDLLARVFKSKLSILHDKITNGEFFGQMISMVHVIEFQKRGLPHAHILIILKSGSKYMTPEAYDRIVCSELPDKDRDPYLYSLVVKHMMHGPCGEMNPECACMRDGRCKNHYPKDFCDLTVHGKGSYPIYRRRNDGRQARVRGHTLDNRWVVPYNPTLLAEFNCHVNVEICCNIRAVKYLYKYVHKGHDKVMFRVAPNSVGTTVDEISNFQNARWVSPVEAVWRLFAFPLHGIHPSVIQLQIHLPNFQTIHFEDDADLGVLLRDDKLKRTMLTEFFRLNSTDTNAIRLQLLYKDFPKHFVWNSSLRTWKIRKHGYVIGRICMVSPVESERYYLRILLSNVKCPTSFDDLLTVNGELSTTFREAAYKRGLLHDDDDIAKTMEEASVFRMPFELRRLFATLLHYCEPSNAQDLFDRFYPYMSEDFTRNQVAMQLSESDILQKVLQGINDTLESLGRDINEFQLVTVEYVSSDTERLTREVAAEINIPIPDDDLHAIHKLNAQQKLAFDTILDHALSNRSGVFFVDGPGGTGKSFLYRVLIAHIRSLGFIAIVVASSGIAASNFLGGRTAHSRFRIPIDGGTGVKCQIPLQSSEAELIRTSKIIIWDEAPMANKLIIQALNKFLQELCQSNEPFGGKLIVFGGDFRQVLPVIQGGGRNEQINASIVSSTLWSSITKLRLIDNIRARDDPGFIDFLMRVGNGEEPSNTRGEIEIPQAMLIQYKSMEQSLEELILHVYPDMELFVTEPYEMTKRVILCPKNEFVDDINSVLIRRLPGDEVVYISDDRAKNYRDQGEYVDYLNSLEPRGIPQHLLVLKKNSPVILLRNINPVEGLCNGTRMICKHLFPNVVGAEIAAGQFKGRLVWIPRIPLEPKPGDNKYMIPFVRRQIPLKLCFAMTINKSQGQTLDFVGIYLKQPVFSHGQLYVALSRARTGENVKVLIIPPTCNDPGTKYTANVVYDEILMKARG